MSDLTDMLRDLSRKPPSREETADRIEALEAEVERLRAAERRLNDLMAVIHRDGGHHREAVGDEQAWLDAMREINDRAAALYSLQAEVERLRRIMDDAGSVIELQRERRLADAALLRQALEALTCAEWVDLPTKLEQSIDDAIAALRARLGETT